MGWKGVTLQEAVRLLRKLISDEDATGFVAASVLEMPEATDELINYLDRATRDYCSTRAAKKDIRLVKKVSLSDGQSLPEDYIAFCGMVPLSVSEGRVQFYGPFQSREARYFRRYRLPSTLGLSDELDGDAPDQRTIVGLAAAFALNKHEFDVSQDLKLLLIGEADGGSGK
jgi:hypothetical protein